MGASCGPHTPAQNPLAIASASQLHEQLRRGSARLARCQSRQALLSFSSFVLDRLLSVALFWLACILSAPLFGNLRGVWYTCFETRPELVWDLGLGFLEIIVLCVLHQGVLASQIRSSRIGSAGGSNCEGSNVRIEGSDIKLLVLPKSFHLSSFSTALSSGLWWRTLLNFCIDHLIIIVDFFIFILYFAFAISTFYVCHCSLLCGCT